MKDLKFISRKPNEDLVRIIQGTFDSQEIKDELCKILVEKKIKGAYVELKQAGSRPDFYKTEFYIPTTELTKYLGMKQ